MHHGIYIMGCIWQPFWILQEKVGISFYFWVIRVVNSQLALYSHVRCSPLDTANTPKHPHMTVTNFNYEGSYLPGVICNIVVKADLSRSAGRSTPQPPVYWCLVVKNGNFTLLLTSCGQEWQLADLLADQPPLVLTSSGQEWQLADLPPPPIKHRCPEYHYTKHYRFLIELYAKAM